MAKAKKTTTLSKSSTGSKPATSSKSAIDQTATAALVAAMIGRKVGPKSANEASPSTESTSFKNMKDSLAKPHANAIGGALDKISPAGGGKSGQPMGGGKQIGHNQTFGSDASRKNVPRRTGG